MKLFKKVNKNEKYTDAIIGYKYKKLSDKENQIFYYPLLVISLYIPYLFNIRFYRDVWNRKFFVVFTYYELINNKLL